MILARWMEVGRNIAACGYSKAEWLLLREGACEIKAFQIYV